MSKLDFSSRLDPQMAECLVASQDQVSDPGLVCEMPVEEARAVYNQERRYWNADGPEIELLREDCIPGPHGDIPLRCYRPSSSNDLPALVFLHGGGWILGNLDTHDKIMRLLAQRSGFAVVGVDYRLAPEHRFPVALEEAVAAVEYLAGDGGEWGLDPNRLAVGGDSAGAHLSLGTCLALREKGVTAIKACLLYYGAFGLADSVSRRCFGGSEDGMDSRDLAYYRECLLNSPDEVKDRRYDLLRNDLSGLPELFIAAAELDPVLDDSRALAEMLSAIGAPHKFKIYGGVLHGFLHYSRRLDKALRAIEDGAAFLRARLLDADTAVRPS